MTAQHDLLARLDAELGLIDDVALAGVELLPSRLAQAAAVVLAVDGASLSLLSRELRVPLGASSPAATAAERLQFTVGQGPCLDVLNGGLPLRASVSDLASTWPEFHRELSASTPFRSVVAVPLPFGPDGDGGAFDLYLVDADGSDRVDVEACVLVADRIVELLVRAIPLQALAGADDASDVAWLRSDATRARMEVWVAIGMLTAERGLTAADGLAVLRAWAYSHDSDVDRIAAQTVAGTLAIEQLHPGGGDPGLV